MLEKVIPWIDVVRELRRIADALERAYPPVPKEQELETPSVFYTDQEYHQLREILTEQGILKGDEEPDAERRKVSDTMKEFGL